jgi:hypothetical protein
MKHQPTVSAVLSFQSRATGRLNLSTRLFLLLIAVSFLLNCCSNPNERANKLFVEAASALEGMKDSPTSTKADKLAAWLKASDLLDKIIKDFPGSEIAVQLVQNKPIIDGKSLAEFRAMPEQMKEKWCLIQLKLNGLAAVVWANDHGDTLPRNYSELCQAVAGIPPETNRTGLADLVCPKVVAFDLQAGARQKAIRPEEVERIGYSVVQFGLKHIELNENKTWLRCPNCGHEVHVDGSVRKR